MHQTCVCPCFFLMTIKDKGPAGTDVLMHEESAQPWDRFFAPWIFFTASAETSHGSTHSHHLTDCHAHSALNCRVEQDWESMAVESLYHSQHKQSKQPVMLKEKEQNNLCHSWISAENHRNLRELINTLHNLLLYKLKRQQSNHMSGLWIPVFNCIL